MIRNAGIIQSLDVFWLQVMHNPIIRPDIRCWHHPITELYFNWNCWHQPLTRPFSMLTYITRLLALTFDYYILISCRAIWLSLVIIWITHCWDYHITDISIKNPEYVLNISNPQYSRFDCMYHHPSNHQLFLTGRQ